MEYINHGMASPQSHEGTLMRGYSRVVLGNVVAYTNGKLKQGKDWYRDGSKLIQGEDSEIHRAATALTCGDLEVISEIADLCRDVVGFGVGGRYATRLHAADP